MKRRKLRKFVLPTIYIMTISALFVGISFMATQAFRSSDKKYLFSLNPLVKEVQNVVNDVKEKNPIEPVDENTAEKNVHFYDMNDTEEAQQKSLIFYENTYMESTGLLYSANEGFEVLAVLDGTIKSVKKDDIMGNVVEVMHDNNIVTVYYCLKDVAFKEGDKINQGDVIAKSGTSKLETNSANNLFFEVYKNGNAMNPEKFFTTSIEELKK